MQRLFIWIRTSLVVRTTLAVLLGTLVMGLLVDRIADPLAHQIATQRQRQTLENILDVAEPSAAAACFAHDQLLARQVTQSLVGARLVQGAVLRSDQQTLSEVHRPSSMPDSDPMERSLKSPFSEEISIGKIILFPNPEEVRKQVHLTAYLVRISLGAVALAMGVALALVVHRLVTRPIQTLSVRLHRLRAADGELLVFPAGHEEDEIGQLVHDVNALVGRLMKALHQERDLSRRVARDHAKMKAILSVAGAGILVLDAEGRLEEWNPACERLLGLEQTPSSLGISASVLFGLEGHRIEELLNRCRESQTHQEVTLPISLLEEQPFRWIQVSSDPIGSEGLLCILSDVTQQQQATEEAQAMATRDALTGVLNRLGADRMLEERLASDHSGFALLLLDLDRFKQVNDTYGHEAGDLVLKEAAHRIVKGIRRTDHVARLGGDEFLVLVEGPVPPQKALELGNKLVAQLSLPIPLGATHEALIGASIGVAMVRPGQSLLPKEVLNQADQAMYVVKQRGRNGVALFE